MPRLQKLYVIPRNREKWEEEKGRKEIRKEVTVVLCLVGVKP